MAKKRVFVVYVIRNLLDGKMYIGKTSGRSVFVAIETRLKQHRYDALKGRGSYLHQAMRKHGVENFEIGHLHVCKTERGAFALEVMEIARFAPEYNLTLGGEGITGFRHTDQTRAKMSGRRSPMKPEQKEKLRQAFLGKPKTPEHARNISLGKTGTTYKKHTKLSAGGVAIKQAREAGSKFYSTGVQCNMGHVSPRYVSTRQCCECHHIRSTRLSQNQTEMHYDRRNHERSRNQSQAA